MERAAALTARDGRAAAKTLAARIADVHSVAAGQVVVGCGSSEILGRAVQALAGPQKKIMAAVPSRELIEELAVRAGAEVVPVPLNDLFAHDLDAMLARLDESVGLVYICNPNDPTGTLTRRSDVERFLQRLPPAVHVLIDEVYHPYVASGSADAVSFLDRPAKDRRLIVVRSFSTVHGLDGLRVGYAVADGAICRMLRDRLPPDDVNAVGAAAALAALEDPGHVRESVRRNEDDRQEFFNEAGARMVRSIDSHTNFVMLDTDRPSLRVIEHFKTNGIAIAGNFPYFAKHIRVSIGTADEMREFWRVWDLMPRQQMKM